MANAFKRIPIARKMYPIVKSFFDRFIALVVFILLLPLFLLLLLLLFLQNGGSPLFKQIRPGYKTQFFTIYKLKTMTDARNSKGELLPDFERITPLGKIIRKLSLDELPQLVNVIKGEMSFVGPRPLLPEYLPLYSEEQNQRHNVKPGITGWAQVNGRNALTWKEKFNLDVYYVHHQSFWLDLKILLMTQNY